MDGIYGEPPIDDSDIRETERNHEFFYWSDKIQLLKPEEILNLPSPSWLIKNVLPKRGLAVLYGAPGVGKSFAAVSACLCVANGLSFGSHRTSRGHVVYVAAEGAPGVGRRFAAWHQHHGLDPNDSLFSLVTIPLPLSNAHAVDALLAKIRSTLGEGDVALVVFDTLSRCIGEADENQAGDMNVIVDNCERVIEELGCSVLLVHHSPKGGDTPRGSSVLSGAVHTLLHAERDGSCSISHILKQKDGEAGQTIRFDSVEVDLGVDADGDPVSVPVFIPSHTVAGRSLAKPTASGTNQQALLDLLIEAEPLGLSLEDWRRTAMDRNLMPGVNQRRAFREAAEGLTRNGLVRESDGKLHPAA